MDHLELIVEALVALIPLTFLLYVIFASWETFLSTSEYYKIAMENAPIVLSVIDAAGCFILSEGQSLKVLEQKTEQKIGKSIFTLYQDNPPLLADIRRSLAGETLTVQHDIGPLTFEIHLLPIQNAKKQTIRVITVATEVTKRVRAERALRHQACYDSITDLATPTFLYERIAQELQSEEQKDLALLMRYLDHFRGSYDTFG